MYHFTNLYSKTITTEVNDHDLCNMCTNYHEVHKSEADPTQSMEVFRNSAKICLISLIFLKTGQNCACQMVIHSSINRGLLGYLTSMIRPLIITALPLGHTCIVPFKEWVSSKPCFYHKEIMIPKLNRPTLMVFYTSMKQQ